MRHGKLIIMMLILLMIALWIRPGLADSEPEDEAPDLTNRCRYYIGDDSHWIAGRALKDDSIDTSFTLKAGQRLFMSWEDGTDVDSVFAVFYHAPEHCTIVQYDGKGTELSRESCPAFINYRIKTAKKTRAVMVCSDDEIVLCSMHAYGKGSIRDSHPWDYAVKKLDYMVFAMHPDDDVLFMGAIVPVYGAEQGKEGRIVYCTPSIRIRADEAQNGAWTMGLRNAPLFGPFGDFSNATRADSNHWFDLENIVRYVVRVLREHRPEVVFSHDIKGEYGHWQHARLSRAVLQAVELAADPTYDPWSVGQFGTWSVKKLYLHLYPENRISVPATEPLRAFDGKTAVDVAAEAYACHRSQKNSKHAVRNEGRYSLSDFGLAYTVVGEDTPGRNDPFEHVSRADLAGLYIAEDFGMRIFPNAAVCGKRMLGALRRAN